MGDAGFISMTVLPAIVKAQYSDLHVHTRHSKDCHDERATFMTLAKCGRAHKIAIGFADHLDARHFPMEDLCFREENIGAYLEEFDEARSQYPEITLGVEMEYYPDRPDLMELTLDWLDRHRKDLDRVLGSAHFVFGNHAITWPPHMERLVGKRTFEEILDEYLRGERAMVESGLADCLTHADVVFRGCAGVYDIDAGTRARGEVDIVDLCRVAMSRAMAIEFNLLGILDGTDRGTSPPWKMIEQLIREGAEVYVGSDAHSVETFLSGWKHIVIANDAIGQAQRGLYPFG